MERILMGLTFILGSTRLLPGTESRTCLQSWTKWESTCIRIFKENKTWDSSRSFCQQRDADLAQPLTTFTMNTIQSLMADGNDRWFWIGIRDKDGNGAYTFLNGDKVPGTFPPGLCVAVSKDSITVVGFNCQENRGFICEYIKSSQKVKNNKTHCTLDGRCHCNKTDWIVSNDTKKDRFVIINKVQATYAMSKVICGKLGAELATLIESTGTLIQQRLKDENIFLSKKAWVGLRRCEDNWCWSNGTTLNPDGYVNWFQGVPQENGSSTCVCVAWSRNGDNAWETCECEKEIYQTCEAVVPCASKPSMNINDGPAFQGISKQPILKVQDVHIKCLLGGYKAYVEELHLECEEDEAHPIAVVDERNHYIHKKLYIDLHLHNKKCDCKAISYDDTTETTEFTIDFQTFPYFIHNFTEWLYEVPVRMQQQVASSGFYIAMEIVANPTPIYFNLSKAGQPMGQEDFDIAIENQVGDDLEHLVGLYMNFSCGAYNLTISNALLPDLIYIFDIKCHKRHDNDYHRMAATICFIILGIISIMRLVFFIYFIINLEAVIRWPIVSFKING